MWPADRLREHNGEALGCEEKETSKHRPWETLCVVHSFSDWEDAEDFAAAWKRPYSNPATKERARELLSKRGISTAYCVTRRLRELFMMLHLAPWRDWGLTISFTTQASYDMARVLTGFDTCRTDIRSLDTFPLKANANISTLSALDNIWRRCVHLTREQKRTIGLYARQHPGETQTQLAEWAKDQFGLNLAASKSAIYDTLKRRQQFEPTVGKELTYKKSRTVHHAVGLGPPLDEVAAASAVVPEPERVAWTKSHQRSAAQVSVDDVQAMQRLIQLAIEMRCGPSITLELNRMLVERSGTNPTRNSRSDAAPPAQPAAVYPFFTLRTSPRRDV
jgi:hypothetical protein